MKVVEVTNSPAAVGPYSQAIVANGFVFCSGQIGLNPETNSLVDGVENQTHQVLKNLQAVLEEAGSSLDNVVKTTLFVKNINDYTAVNEIYEEYFSKSKPVRATVEAASLVKGALVEIDAIALAK